MKIRWFRVYSLSLIVNNFGDKYLQNYLLLLYFMLLFCFITRLRIFKIKIMINTLTYFFKFSARPLVFVVRFFLLPSSCPTESSYTKNKVIFCCINTFLINLTYIMKAKVCICLLLIYPQTAKPNIY